MWKGKIRHCCQANSCHQACTALCRQGSPLKGTSPTAGGGPLRSCQVSDTDGLWQPPLSRRASIPVLVSKDEERYHGLLPKASIGRKAVKKRYSMVLLLPPLEQPAERTTLVQPAGSGAESRPGSSSGAERGQVCVKLFAVVQPSQELVFGQGTRLTIIPTAEDSEKRGSGDKLTFGTGTRLAVRPKVDRDAGGSCVLVFPVLIP
ncbi:hypothetical protein CB1_000233027 [Camelus ferus]|nr:hypothetical protein CB1_000233027 [Camelus ferus]